MARWIYMKKSPELSDKIKATLATFHPQPPDLIFPVNPDFDSKPPRLPWTHAYELCEQALSWNSRRPDFEENRLAQKVDVEFVL